jgi:hypothetical protein
VGRTHEERWGAVDDLTHRLNEQLGKIALMTGAQFPLRHIDESQKQPKAKCPFTPQREMITKLWAQTARRNRFKARSSDVMMDCWSIRLVAGRRVAVRQRPDSLCLANFRLFHWDERRRQNHFALDV